MQSADVVIVGGGAAGLATAIFAARTGPRLRIVIVDGAKRLGAKILVSGGGRCNVTNAVVTPEDFDGGSRNVIRRVLQAFPVGRTVAFFAELGVGLHEEENGKLFPDTNQARTVLDALLAEAARLGVTILAGHRATGVARQSGGFAIATAAGQIESARLVLATGGRSLPKTGSDGSGYALAESLGHTIVPTAPALVPLVLEGEFHKPLSGISHPVEVILRVAGGQTRRFRGSMLWTHFGVSGPAILDASGEWHRARLDGAAPEVALNLLPGATFESLERRFLDLASSNPRTTVQNALHAWLPVRVCEALLAEVRVFGGTPLAHLSRELRRKVVRDLLEWPLRVSDSRGYQYAEVTSGGVPLEEIHPATLESRRCEGLCLVGEILNVHGRLGGYNFQWAWSTAHVVGVSIATRWHS